MIASMAISITRSKNGSVIIGIHLSGQSHALSPTLWRLPGCDALGLGSCSVSGLVLFAHPAKRSVAPATAQITTAEFFHDSLSSRDLRLRTRLVSDLARLRRGVEAPAVFAHPRAGVELGVATVTPLVGRLDPAPHTARPADDGLNFGHSDPRMNTQQATSRPIPTM